MEPPVGIEPTTFSLRDAPALFAAVHCNASTQVKGHSPGGRVRADPAKFTGLA